MDARRCTGGRLQPMVLSSGPNRPPSPLTKWQRPQSWRAYSSRPASGSPVSAISAGARSERTKATICHISLSDRRTDGMPVFGMPLSMFMKIARSLLPWRYTSRVRSGPRSPRPSAPWQTEQREANSSPPTSTSSSEVYGFASTPRWASIDASGRWAATGAAVTSNTAAGNANSTARRVSMCMGTAKLTLRA